MKLSAAERRRPTLLDGLVVLLVLLCAIVPLLKLHSANAAHLSATLVLDGVTLGTYDLTTLSSPKALALDAPWPMEVELTQDGARVKHSDCGSQDCVRTGQITRAGEQIICLPNRLIISLVGSSTPDFDAISG